MAIILSTFLLSSCTENRTENSDGSILKKSHFISYCAKEENEENRIYFNYPQFQETVANADDFNILILGFVESALQDMYRGEFKGNLKDSPETWTWDNNSYTLQAMNINYEIKRNDFDYLSVTFEGVYNDKLAAHPINYFNSFTIALNEKKLVSLSDLYRVDIEFAELVQMKFKEEVRMGLAEKMGISINEIPESVEESLPFQNGKSFLEYLQHTDKNKDYGFHSFLTDTALGISVPLGYALGDHFEMIIPYDILKAFTL